MVLQQVPSGVVGIARTCAQGLRYLCPCPATIHSFRPGSSSSKFLGGDLHCIYNSADTHLLIRFQNRHDGYGSMNKHFSFLSLSPALESFSKTLLTFSRWSSLFLPLRCRQLTLLHVRFLVRDSSCYVERSQVQTRLQTTGDFIDRVPCVCLMSHTL